MISASICLSAYRQDGMCNTLQSVCLELLFLQDQAEKMAWKDLNSSLLEIFCLKRTRLLDASEMAICGYKMALCGYKKTKKQTIGRLHSLQI